MCKPTLETMHGGTCLLYMDMLIEACVAEFNLTFLQKAKEDKRNGNVSET